MKLQKSQELDHIIVQVQLEMKQKILSMIKNYLKKDMSPEKRKQIIKDLRLI